MKKDRKFLHWALASLTGSLLLAFAQPAIGQLSAPLSLSEMPQPPKVAGQRLFELQERSSVEKLPPARDVSPPQVTGERYLQAKAPPTIETLPPARTDSQPDPPVPMPLTGPRFDEVIDGLEGISSTEDGESNDGFDTNGEPIGDGGDFYTTGAPIVGDGGFFFYFPEEEHHLYESPLEILPTVLTWPNEPLGNMLGKLLFSERDELETALHDEALDIQPVPERPPLVVEWNERFLGPGPLAPGVTIPTGAVWRPAVWVWGETRTGINYFDNAAADPIAEWANRVDLFTQLNLSGTERFVWAVRPLDEETDDGTMRRFAGYDFREGDWLPGGNFNVQSLFFEGDFGEMFPFLDPYDFRALDYGMSMGRMPILAQQGLLINEDLIDAVTVTRNTLYGLGNLNLRITGVYAWGEITRNSPLDGLPNRLSSSSNMLAILTESDYNTSTINADVAYAYGDPQLGDVLAVGVSSIRRHYMNQNTYNTSLHWLASYPTDGEGTYATLGQLLFGQLSWTPHHFYDLIYLNAFWAIDEFTSPARGPLMGGPLGQTGILFAGTGLGRFGAPIPVRTNNTAGASLGYQWFFDETRKQVIWEIGGVADTKGGQNDDQIGTALRYQQAIGQHYIWLIDGFVAKRESNPTGSGARTEVRVKF